MTLPSIVDEFRCREGCGACGGTGHVCEEHPDRPWEGVAGPLAGCPCLAPGAPCPRRHDGLMGSLDTRSPFLA